MDKTGRVAVRRFDPLLRDLEMPLRGVFYPVGFPLNLATNSHEVIAAAEESFGAWTPEFTVDPGLLNRNMVLQNSVLFGSVNANRRHYELAAKALAQADPRWLADLITRQVPIGQWADAYTRRPDDVKTVLNFAAGSRQAAA